MRGRRLHDIKHNYFDNIDSAMKAYLLGFFMADGSIEVNQTGRYCIRFIQKESDIAILKLLQTEISPSSKMENIVRGTKVYGRLSITSTELGNALIALGLLVRKTYHEFKLPIIPDIYTRDIIRGYFDGDGTAGIYLSKANYAVRQVRIVSYSKQVLVDIQKVLSLNNIRATLLTTRTYWYISILSYKEWYNYLYPGITTFSRKQKNCELCTLTSSEIKSLKSLNPCNA